MRTSLALLVACVFVVTSAVAQDKDVQQVDVAKLINALASENPTPTERRGLDLKYPPDYDRKKQESVRSAMSKLKSLGPTAFKTLIANWGDKRYCLTYSVGINGYMNNATVGQMCRFIVYDQIQPYGIWPLIDGDPRGKSGRPTYPGEFLADARDADRWLEEHKGKSLFEMQLLVVDWVIDQESKNLKDFTDEERKYMQDIRKKVTESKKPMTRGNYYAYDYD